MEYYNADVENEDGNHICYRIGVRRLNINDEEIYGATSVKTDPLSDNMLEIVKSIAADSMQQEKDRAELIKSKSENLVKYVSATIGVANTIVVFMLDRKVIEIKALFWIAILVDFPLLLSLIMAVAAQIMLKGLYYPSGIGVIQDLIKDGREKTNADFEIYRLKCMKEFTSSLCVANDKRAKCIKWSYVFYLFSIGLSIVYVIRTLWCI